MREHNHHHAIDNLLAFDIRKLLTCALVRSLQDFCAKDVVDEVLHHDVHITFGCGSESTRFDMLLPLMEVGLLQDLLPVCVELVELVFEKLSHNSEA